jgi:hypothetical protein
MSAILLSTPPAYEAVGRRLAHYPGMGKLSETPTVCEHEKTDRNLVLHDWYGNMHCYRYACLATLVALKTYTSSRRCV